MGVSNTTETLEQRKTTRVGPSFSWVTVHSVCDVKLNMLYSITLVLNAEEIHIFKVNTKYISSHVLTLSAILQVRCTSEIADIFNISDKLFLVFT